MSAETGVRCSAIVLRGDDVLLVHREGGGDWVLPGGTPRPGESMAACARRETLEETGLAVDPARVAFIAEALAPGPARRAVDLVFLAIGNVSGDPVPAEPGLEARFVPLAARRSLTSARRWPGTCAGCTPAAVSPQPPTWETCGARSAAMAKPPPRRRQPAAACRSAGASAAGRPSQRGPGKAGTDAERGRPLGLQARPRGFRRRGGLLNRRRAEGQDLTAEGGLDNVPGGVVPGQYRED